MAKAIEAGIPKLRIEEAAARTQARIDSGAQAVSASTSSRRPTNAPIEVLRVDNSAVRTLQIDKLRRLRAERDEAAVDGGARGTVARRGVGRRQPPGAWRRCGAGEGDGRRDLGGAGEGLGPPSRRDQGDLGRLQAGGRVDVRRRSSGCGALVEAFERDDGRRPRILVAKMGQDGHDRGQKVIASAFADLGFDVDIGPLFATPGEAARQAIENDVHIVGVSSLAAGHLTLVPELKRGACGRAAAPTS